MLEQAQLTEGPVGANPDAGRIVASRAELKSLGGCFREFLRHFSPCAALTAALLAAWVRLELGEWTWRDFVVPALVLVHQPFVEWFLHKYLLHLKPFSVLGRTVEIYPAYQHRVHHLDPANLQRVFLKPPEVTSAIVGIAVSVPLAVVPWVWLFGGPFFALASHAVLWAYVGLVRYEWCHFMSHCPYVPRSERFKRVLRDHRLHHFKNEHYWMGVTSNLGDLVLRTYPDQRSVEKSPTARTLGVDLQA